MKEKIQKVLKLLEKDNNIKIIYACESGSRAWGFESKDSDYDIRFIFIPRPEYYLDIFENCNHVLDKNNNTLIYDMNKFDLDFVGWDIHKTLYNISKSNPDLIAWLNSPIIYTETNEIEIVKNHIKDFFKPICSYYHYLHMAIGNYNQYIRNPEGNLVNTKKYLYVLRPLLCCNWIEIKNSIPPMEFKEIYQDNQIKNYLTDTVFNEIIELIIKKISGSELDNQPRNPILDIFIEQQFARYEHIIKQLDLDFKPDYNSLNKTFQTLILGERK